MFVLPFEQQAQEYQYNQANTHRHHYGQNYRLCTNQNTRNGWSVVRYTHTQDTYFVPLTLDTSKWF